MSQLRLISPLLDNMSVEKEGPELNGRASYTLRHMGTGERYHLKRLSVPASDSLIRALILSGAYPDEAAVHEYYGKVAEGIRAELEIGKVLAASGCFVGALNYQIVPKEEAVGYDVYILYPLNVPLNVLLAENAMSHLRAINLGIDLCDAISACREAGYLFENIRPESIFLMSNGKFLLGDLGLAELEDLAYSSVPEEYIGSYSAPELSEITAAPNLTIDLYALGMVLYRIYNGNHGPFEDENTAEAMANKLRLTGKPLPTPIFADYELAGIILKACSFKPEDRFSSPEQLKQALVMYMQRNEISDTPIVPPIISPDVVFSGGAEEETEEDQPVRMSNAEELDETFRRSFAPDTSGAGTEKDIDPEQASQTLPLQPEEDEPTEEDDLPEADEAAEAEPSAQEPSVEELLSEDDPEETRQMSFDELLASVENVMAEKAPDQEENPSGFTIRREETPASSHTYVDSHGGGPVEETKSSSHSKLPRLLLILFLIAAIGVVVFFLITWYFVEATELKHISITTDEVVMQLVTPDSPESFTLTCMDSNGKTYPVSVEGDIYTFSGLEELSTYTIGIDAAKSHRLKNSSIREHQVSTLEATKIIEFTVNRGKTDGEVLLNFQFEGPDPTLWRMSYTNEDGSHQDNFLFEGNAYLIDGLKANETYTFTLEDSENCYMAGNHTVTYEMLPIVAIDALGITQVNTQGITLSWQSLANTPEEWTVSCEAEGMDPIVQKVSGTSCSIALNDFTRDYTISVNARGMDHAETLTLPADPIIVEDLTATANEDGTVTLTWQTPAGAPTGGWYVSYNAAGSLHDPYLYSSDPIMENTLTMKNLFPNTEYEIALSISAADASRMIFGNTTLTVTTGDVIFYEGYSLTPATPLETTHGYVSLWLLPEKSDWKFTDLHEKRTAFSPDEQIAICIQVNGVAASESSVNVAYAIRNAQGQVVNDIYDFVPWNDLWYSRRHASAIPLPAKEGESAQAGDYTVEVYINGCLLAKAGFTVS